MHQPYVKADMSLADMQVQQQVKHRKVQKCQGCWPTEAGFQGVLTAPHLSGAHAAVVSEEAKEAV